MIIAMDYDDCFTLSPEGWHKALTALRSSGFTVWGVTARNRLQPIMCPLFNQVCEHILYCAGQAKKPLMRRVVGDVAVWVDDKPQYILTSYAEVHGADYLLQFGLGEDDFVPLLHHPESGLQKDIMA